MCLVAVFLQAHFFDAGLGQKLENKNKWTWTFLFRVKILWRAREGRIVFNAPSQPGRSAALHQDLFCVSVPVSKPGARKWSFRVYSFEQFDWNAASASSLCFSDSLSLWWPRSRGLQHSCLNPSITQTLRYNLRLPFPLDAVSILPFFS